MVATATFLMGPLLLVVAIDARFADFLALARTYHRILLPSLLVGLVCFAYFPAMAIMAILRRRRNLRTMPAPVQLRLSPEGFALKEGIGAIKVVPWTPGSSFALTISGIGQPKFKIRKRRRWSLDWTVEPKINPETAEWVVARVQSWIAQRAGANTNPPLVDRRG
jgi:hypothetical protein